MVDVGEMIEQGGIHFHAILEMVGKPKKHVVETFTQYIDKIAEDPQMEIISRDMAEPVKTEDSDSMFSTFCELEIVVKKPNMIYDFCFKYMPASVEVVDPQNLKFQAADFSNLVNDFIAKMHTVEMESKTQKQQIRVLGTNLNVMATNLIIVLVKGQPLPLKTLVKHTGVEAKQLEQLLGMLVEQGKLQKEGDLYKLEK